LPLPIVKLMLLPLFDVVLLVMTLDYPTGVSTGCKEDIIITKISEVYTTLASPCLLAQHPYSCYWPPCECY
jgi:hypothetical protein